mgnify:CR=1 FL=1
MEAADPLTKRRSETDPLGALTVSASAPPDQVKDKKNVRHGANAEQAPADPFAQLDRGSPRKQQSESSARYRPRAGENSKLQQGDRIGFH